MAENKNTQALDVNDALSSSEAFVSKNKKTIIGAVVAIVVIVCGFFLYRTYIVAPNEEKASTMIAKGQTYFAQDDYEKSLNGDGAGFIGFVKLAKEYSSTDAGNLANYYAGLCYNNMGKTKEAIKSLEEFNPADDQMLSPAAIGALGNLYAKDNQLDKAVESLKKAAKLADNNSISPIYLIQAGEILEKQNKAEEALKLYKEVKDKYFNSLQAQEIDKYIERASK